MQRVTVTLEQEHIDSISEVQEEGEADSKSEAVRYICEEYERLQREYNELHTEYERVRNEKQTIVEQREENTELVKYAEEQRTLERQWKEAGLATRLKWKVFGMDSDE